MQENKNQLVEYAMQSRIFLGLFWVLKYFMQIAGNNSPIIQLFTTIFSLGTAVLFLYFLSKYIAKTENTVINYWHGVQFGILLFFFASTWESIVALVHITWIDVQYIDTSYQKMIETVKQLNLDENLIKSIENRPAPSPVSFIINNVILSNIFFGLLLSLILVPVANRNILFKRN